MQMSNRTMIERSFCSSVVRSRTLTPHQTGQLMMFMADYFDVLWTPPNDVTATVHQRLYPDERDRSIGLFILLFIGLFFYFRLCFTLQGVYIAKCILRLY